MLVQLKMCRKWKSFHGCLSVCQWMVDIQTPFFSFSLASCVCPFLLLSISSILASNEFRLNIWQYDVQTSSQRWNVSFPPHTLSLFPTLFFKCVRIFISSSESHSAIRWNFVFVFLLIFCVCCFWKLKNKAWYTFLTLHDRAVRTFSAFFRVGWLVENCSVFFGFCTQFSHLPRSRDFIFFIRDFTNAVVPQPIYHRMCVWNFLLRSHAFECPK